MKLARAIYWFFVHHNADGFIKSKAFQMLLYFVIAFFLLCYFFFKGIENENQTQFIGCGFGLFLISIPFYTWSRTIVHTYEEHTKN